MTKKLAILISILLIGSVSIAQNLIPDVFTNIHYDKEGKLYHINKQKKYYNSVKNNTLSLSNLQGNPKATESGLQFNFNDPTLSGTLYYGLIDYEDSKYPTPIWYKATSKIEKGKAKINILRRLSGKYDMTSWRERGRGTLGYRVANDKGMIMYDGVVGFKFTEEQKFSIATTIIEGPFINLIKPDGVTISFVTNFPIQAKIIVANKTYESPEKTTHHEIEITDHLMPATNYTYKVDYKDGTQEYMFKTAPKPGARTPFVFAYTSDSRAGQGGGERSMYGVNYYVMRKNAALAKYHNAAFMQFTGDLVDGYTSTRDEIELQYANWKRALEPFAHHFPVITTMGNHEAVGKIFRTDKGYWAAFVPGFPFETESPSAIFAKNFVNPHSDLLSEDGAYYDPDPYRVNFPPYNETVFYYTYDNVAMIVLNSDYWYVPTLINNPTTGGNLHGYIMDKQLEWLEKTLLELENDENIDHIFVTQHTPVFPNGGHVKDDMWYNGDNSPRPIIAGKPVKKGIIERRDEYLDLLINKSNKVIAVLTGDEHNYNKVEISPSVNIYPKEYPFPKLDRKRTLWQINNGACGAPYYAQNKKTPWTDAVSGFSTQLALVLFYIDGTKVHAKVLNPDTLDMIDEFVLRE